MRLFWQKGSKDSVPELDPRQKENELMARYRDAVKVATDPGSAKDSLLPALLMLATYGRGSVPGIQRKQLPGITVNTGYGPQIMAAAENVNKLIMSPDKEIGDASLAALRGLAREYDYFGPELYREFRESDFDPRTAPPDPTEQKEPSDWYKTPPPGKPEEPGSLNHQPGLVQK